MAWKMLWMGILIVLIGSVAPLSLGKGEEASIADLHIIKDKGDLSINFIVKNCFNNKMEEAIKAGVPTTFNFFMKLSKKRSLIWNKKIAYHQFRHNIVYDNLKKNFRIVFEEKGKEILVNSLEEAKAYMERVEGFIVVDKKHLEEGEYELAIKAELDPVKLPLRLEGILFFVSLWDFETDWHYYTVRVEP